MAYEGVIGIEEREEAGGEGDVLGAQAVGVPGALPALMVVAYDPEGSEQQTGDVNQGLLTDDNVAVHGFALGEGPGFEEDGVGDGEPADVVGVGAQVQRTNFGFLHPRELGEPLREPDDPVGMPQGFEVPELGRNKGRASF